MVLPPGFKEVMNLLLHKQLEFGKGRIQLLGEGVVITAVSTRIAEIKLFEENNAENLLYFSAKYTGRTWNEKMQKTYKIKTLSKILEWGNKVMNLAGYGELVFLKSDLKEPEFVWRFNDNQ
ncbi:MAG: hypothetical protein ABH821_04615, partial [archaeon]